MRVQIELHGSLRRKRALGGDTSGFFHEIKPETTVASVVEELGLPRSWIRCCFVNGEPASLERRLSSGDRLVLFPPVGGGSGRSPLP